MKRVCSMLSAVLILTGCSTTDDSFDVVRSTLLPNQQDFDTRFQLAAGQGARQLKLALLEFDAGSIILFDSSRDGIDTWITADGGTVMTQDQMIVGMRGFGAGLMAADVEQPLAMLHAGRQGITERFQTFLTGNDEIVTRTYRCQIVDQGRQEIVIGTTPVTTRLFSEDCRSLDQSFQNWYWLSPSNNRIVQTSQWTGEFIGMVATQVVP